jgi:hypothetical protein
LKRKQFQSWLAAYNNQYTQHVLVKQCQLVPSFSNAWLCGFIDAEGSFSARKNVPRVKWIESICRFFIGAKNTFRFFRITPLFDIVKDSNIGFDKSWQGYRFYLSNKKN